MSRCVIKVEMSLLETLTMIALRIAQTKESLFQEVILFIPKGKSNVLHAMSV